MQIRTFLVSLPATHAAIDELAAKLLRQMNGELDDGEDEQAAAALSQKIAKRFPKGAPPEKVNSVGMGSRFSKV